MSDLPYDENLTPLLGLDDEMDRRVFFSIDTLVPYRAWKDDAAAILKRIPPEWDHVYVLYSANFEDDGSYDPKSVYTKWMFARGKTIVRFAAEPKALSEQLEEKLAEVRALFAEAGA